MLEEPSAAEDKPEPVADPVGVVAPLPLLLSDSPTVRSTWETVPSKVATNDAPLSAFWALVTESCAEVTLALSAAICWLELPADSASARVACALARFASAELSED